MADIDQSIEVNASAEAVWKLLQGIVENPLAYHLLIAVAGPIQRTSEGAFQEFEAFGMKLQEWVKVDAAARRVTYTMADNEHLSGSRLTEVGAGPSQGTVTIRACLSLEPKSEKGRGFVSKSLPTLVKGAVKRWKELAEERQEGK